MNSEQLRKREQQWKQFHEWEKKQLSDSTPLESKLKWFADARKFAQQFLPPSTWEIEEEKVKRLKQLKDAFSKIRV